MPQPIQVDRIPHSQSQTIRGATYSQSNSKNWVLWPELLLLHQVRPRQETLTLKHPVEPAKPLSFKVLTIISPAARIPARIGIGSSVRISTGNPVSLVFPVNEYAKSVPPQPVRGSLVSCNSWGV